jgi:2-polyprenyl-6-methoxyphenol hydroxylase-like FAD-dependent oxidoreductase
MLADILTEEMYNNVQQAACDPYFPPPDPGHLPTFHGATGELMKNVPLLKMIRISRRRFRQYCARDITIQYDRKLDTLSYSTDDSNTVTAHFTNGTTATGTLVVGTEGAQSAVRHTLFPPSKAQTQRLPISAVNLHVHYNDAAKAQFVRQHHPIMTMGIHPDGIWQWISIQDVPDPNDAATWSFQLQSTWRPKEGESDDNVASLAALKKRAETYGEPFRSANLWIPEGTTVSENKLSYWVPEPWDTRNGRVLLAGDAAHPMTFHRGQGLNHGIADARSLVLKLKAAVAGETTITDAAEAYMAEMVERAGDEVRTSKENTLMLHDWARMQDSPLMIRGGYAKGQEAQQAPPVEAQL